MPNERTKIRIIAATRVWLMVLVIVTVIVSASADDTNPRAAPVLSAEGRLAALHNRLQQTADEVLRAVESSARPERPQDARPGEADPARLRTFAQKFWGGNEESLLQALRRLEKLRPVVEPILQEEGVPAELAAVVLIESAARADALSPRGARGLWQFMPDTARRYGLTVSPARDDRLDVLKATRAAARYLRDLYELLGSWPLALAAYNAGEATVEHAVRRAGSDDFSTISTFGLVPAETRNYVPAVLATFELLGGGLRLNTREQPEAATSVLYAEPGISSAGGGR